MDGGWTAAQARERLGWTVDEWNHRLRRVRDWAAKNDLDLIASDRPRRYVSATLLAYRDHLARGGPRPPGKPGPVGALSPEQRQEVIERRRRGESVYAIARTMGLSENLVWRTAGGSSYRRRLSDQVRAEVRRRLEAGESRNALAAALGIGLRTVERIAREEVTTEQ